MTNPNVPPSAPSGGGMPKWLILLLVVFLVVILGCCGGFAACEFMCHRAISAAAEAEKAHAADLNKFAQGVQQMQQAQRDAQALTPPAGVPANDVGNPLGRGLGENTTPQGGQTQNPEVQALATGNFPANFPSDIPKYKGMTPTSISVSNNLTGQGGVVISGAANKDDVTSYYRTEMKNQGWTVTGDQDIGPGTMLTFTKDDRTATVEIGPDTSRAGQVLAVIGYQKK